MPNPAPALSIEDNDAPEPIEATPTRPRTPCEEVIVPSGRAVRLKVVTTAEYLGAKERAAATAGDPTKRPDPRNTRFSAALDRELLALAVTAYTDPIDWPRLLDAQQQKQARAWAEATKGMPDAERPAFVFTPDVAALLAAVPAASWQATTPLALSTPGKQAITEVFDSVADWEVLTRVAGSLLMPSADLAGIVGKAQRVTR